MVAVELKFDCELLLFFFFMKPNEESLFSFEFDDAEFI